MNTLCTAAAYLTALVIMVLSFTLQVAVLLAGPFLLAYLLAKLIT